MDNSEQIYSRPYFDSAIKYGVLTEEELHVLFVNFHLDLADVINLLERIKGEKLKMLLRRKKYLYFTYYFEISDKHLMVQHVFEKVMSFIELAIDNPKRALQGNIFKLFTEIRFQDLFKDKSTCNHVLAGLIEKGIIKIRNEGYEWVDKGKNAGLLLSGLFNYLIRNKLLKEVYKNDFKLISEIMEAEFLIKRSPRTYARMNEPAQRNNWKQFKDLLN